MTSNSPIAALVPESPPAPTQGSRWSEKLGATRRYLARNPSLLVGALMLLMLLAFSVIGRASINHALAEPLAAMPNQPPSADNPFGTDAQGRDLLAVIILGTWLTFKVGVVAGGIGVLLGAVVGFVAAYYRGWVDAILRVTVDVGLTIPPLLFLVVIASSRQGTITSTMMALMIAALAWLGPARQIRAQALVLRESNYVAMARLSGASSLEIIFAEMLPNLLPFLMAGFVLAVSQAILAAVGLEALGLGPTDEPTLGMTVYWMMYNTAFIRGLWWWIIAPIAVLVVLFVSLYLISAGLDEFSNPRLRRRVAA